MALSGRLAAPAIVNTVLPLICASNTVGQVAMGMSTVLSCFGMSSMELIPGIMSSYGAAVAGRKMLNRTAPLKDFALKPLHLDDVERKEQIQRTATADGADTTANGPDVAKNTVLTKQKQHAPVFILVSGHLERGVDPRQLWGADGFLQAAARSTAEVLMEEVTKLVTVNITTTAVTGLFAGDSAVEATGGANAEMSDETILIADTNAESAAGAPNTRGLAVADEGQQEQAELVPQEPREENSAPAAAPQTLTEWEELNSQVSGWWRENITHGEEYVLHWEPSVLESLNESLQKILINKMLGKIKGMVKGEILKVGAIVVS
jgi:hypothetical protein